MTLWEIFAAKAVPVDRSAEPCEEDYRQYVAECEAENLEAHSPEMWLVHGCPTGPLGGE